MYSPYKLFFNKEEGFYYFHTQQMIEYRGFFTQNVSGNSILGLDLSSTVYNFNLVRFTKIEKTTFDRNIGATIGEVLNHFFDKNPDVILNYICDNADSKGGKRQSSFSKWLKLHNKHPKKILIKGSVSNVIYVGAVLLASNPEKNKILSFFRSELENLEDEMSKTGEVVIIES